MALERLFRRRRVQGEARDVPELWIKCPKCEKNLYKKDLEANQFVMPGSNFHMKMTAGDRFKSFFDDGRYTQIAVPDVPVDPLKFRDERRYTDRLRDAREETGLQDAVTVGEGTLDELPVVAAVQDFRFMGGSLGMAAGEAVVTGMLRAVANKSPFVIFAASGGARMQEGMLSLMQMPRTTVAVQMLRKARLPYVVVLTHPTTGGVTASYAMLGDVHIAEPGALIGFAGPRVIEQTIREQLPEGFQRAEYLLAHGMVDMVVHRHNLRSTLSRVCRLLMKQPPQAKREIVAAEVVQNQIAKGEPAMAALPAPLKAGSGMAIEIKASAVSSAASMASVISGAAAAAVKAVTPTGDPNRNKPNKPS